jgi:hypothetical protein
MQPGRVASYKLPSPSVQDTEGEVGDEQNWSFHMYCIVLWNPVLASPFQRWRNEHGGTLMSEGDKGTSFTPDGQ